MTIDQIRQPILNEYNLFLEEYQRRTQSNVALLEQVVDYLNQIPGKQLRPLLVLLSAKACQHLSPLHIKLATAIEMLHNASLMHDDVVDESNSRRQHDSVRHRWGNQVAVLCGDYFLAQVMSLLQEVGNRLASEYLAHTVAMMSQGELMQLDAVHKKVKASSYIDIIGSKTASLLATCCQFGSLAPQGSTPTSYTKALYDFGYHYGIVFQIRDDMNDFNQDHDVALPDDVSPLQLIEEHTLLAQQALKQLPDTPARQTMLDMLLPSAPQPVC
jgi:octaprenyl-diphosphate synthase